MVTAYLPALSFAIGGPIPNLETMMGSKGFERADAVLLASFWGIRCGRAADRRLSLGLYLACNRLRSDDYAGDFHDDVRWRRSQL